MIDYEEIELGVRTAVKAFNDMGLKTLMSCQGHYTPRSYMIDPVSGEETEIGGWRSSGLNAGNGAYISFDLDCEDKLREIVKQSLVRDEKGEWKLQGFRLNIVKRYYPYGWRKEDENGSWVPTDIPELHEQLILQIHIEHPNMMKFFDRFILGLRDKINVQA